jgi:hypothetical protein
MTAAGRGDGRDSARFCGARKRQGEGTCRRPAGWGTDHVGRGRCKLHGGRTPGQRAKDRKDQAAAAVVTFGLPREVEPGQALLEEVHRSAGHVAWLGQLVASLPHDVLATGYDSVQVTETSDTGEPVTRTVLVPRSGLKQLDGQGRFEKPSVWVELYQAERKHLTQVAKAAVDAGIAERAVRLAEDQGRLLAAGLSWLLAKLDRAADPVARQLVSQMLQSLAVGQVPELEAARG